MYLDPKKLTLYGFQLDQGDKGENYVMRSDANGVVSWQPTSLYTTNREFERYVGEHFGGGVVVAVWREGASSGVYGVGVVEKCLIVATQDITYELTSQSIFGNTYVLDNRVPWSDVTNAYAGASSSVFGATNSVRIMAQPGYNYGNGSGLLASVDYANDSLAISPAALWCSAYINPNLGEGVYGDWYLPSVYELTALFSNVAIVNKVLEQISVDKGISTTPKTGNTLGSNVNSGINYVSGDYWASTEKNSATAYIVDAFTRIMPLSKYPMGFITTNESFRKARPFRTDTRRWNGIQWVKDRNSTGRILVIYNTDAIAPYTETIVNNLTSLEAAQGNTVEYVGTYSLIPSDLTVYDHIWDVNVSQVANTVLTNSVIDRYTNYLQQGGAIFLLGENTNFTTRGNSIASFITGLGGGTVTYDPIFPKVLTPCLVAPEFLLKNTTNTLSLNATGRFSNFGTGTSMVTLNTTLNSEPVGAGPDYQPGTPGMAVFWKTGSLANAPSGALAVVLDINFLSLDYGVYNSADFAANLAQVLNKS